MVFENFQIGKSKQHSLNNLEFRKVFNELNENKNVTC
jgi:hypothetical protein